VVLPGPAFLVIPSGLAILAMEYAWARRWLRKARGLLPGDKSRGNLETSSSPPTNYRCARAAASCRNAMPSPQTETPHQPKAYSEQT